MSSSLKLRNLATNPWKGPPLGGPPDVAAAAVDEPGGDDNEADADAVLDVAAVADVGVAADVVVGA